MSTEPPEFSATYLGCEWPIDESCLGDGWDELTPTLKERSLALASNTLRRLTGYRVGGCPITVRPCKQGCGPSGMRYGYNYSGFNWFQPYITEGGAWVNSCGCTGDCSCSTLCEVILPGPVGAVYEVKVDGSVVDADDYRVAGTSLIWMSTETCPWPTCQDLSKADTEEGTFAVTYLNSYPVDGLGAYAAGVLAYEYAQACSGNNCRLPSAVTAMTRQGVSYEIVKGAFPDGFTGLREVDAYIALWNPKGLQQSVRLWTPDMPRVHR